MLHSVATVLLGELETMSCTNDEIDGRFGIMQPNYARANRDVQVIRQQPPVEPALA